MADFLTNLWEGIFVSGPTPTLLLATNLTFGALQTVLLALLVGTRSIHFVILSLLCAGLWLSINWFARELLSAQQAEAEAERLRRRQSLNEAAKQEQTEADDLSNTSKAIKTSSASTTGARLIDSTHRRAQPHMQDRDDDLQSSTDLSTDSDWEQIQPER